MFFFLLNVSTLKKTFNFLQSKSKIRKKWLPLSLKKYLSVIRRLVLKK